MLNIYNYCNIYKSNVQSPFRIFEQHNDLALTKLTTHYATTFQ